MHNVNVNFLVVKIDSKLIWLDHVTYRTKFIGILTKIRRFLNKKSLENLYSSFVYPFLIYCVEVWRNAHDAYLDPLITLQNMYTCYYIFLLFRTYHTPF